MPRVSIKKREYKISDLSQWIKSKMYAKRVMQSEMAEIIGISQPAFSEKLRESRFTYSDLLSIFKRLEASDEEILRIMRI